MEEQLNRQTFQGLSTSGGHRTTKPHVPEGWLRCRMPNATGCDSRRRPKTRRLGNVQQWVCVLASGGEGVAVALTVVLEGRAEPFASCANDSTRTPPVVRG